jgi:hypothetical protein
MPRGLNSKRHAFIADVREEGFWKVMESGQHKGLPLLDNDGYIVVRDNGSIWLEVSGDSARLAFTEAKFMVREIYADCDLDYEKMFIEMVREAINNYDPAKAERRSGINEIK